MIVSPSILSADFLNLERDIKLLEKNGADFIHIDIMDGVFVANSTWGPSTVTAIRQITTLPLDVHLMINQPERLIEHYLATKADIITIHPESTVFLRKSLLKIKKYGAKVGVALKLETPVEMIKYCLDLVDIVLLLTCDEGFGGQNFQLLSLRKISQIAKWRQEHNLTFKIEVDGGIGPETGKLCKEAGADILVAGSYVFGKDIKTAIEVLKKV
ncbi:ribulose-phosphate 3-epimerase [Irregularibacter muris]|uniref:Ribulose-phosphate 3-epimerase n=1 Tax=Irregularibacter muris TaxID=1796619 RepID=A0AAE3HHM0_9FIRM|nr:ribulose-phosphate 3-epimerase [Irregularibacter muris]MCR1899104.1 ribulose-phosphate 3-epimerase [Irregularibacter muris]